MKVKPSSLYLNALLVVQPTDVIGPDRVLFSTVYIVLETTASLHFYRALSVVSGRTEFLIIAVIARQQNRIPAF